MITLVLKMSDVRSKGSELCKISYELYCTLKLQSILSLCNSSEGKFKKVSFSV